MVTLAKADATWSGMSMEKLLEAGAWRIGLRKGEWLACADGMHYLHRHGGSMGLQLLLSSFEECDVDPRLIREAAVREDPLRKEPLL